MLQIRLFILCLFCVSTIGVQAQNNAYKKEHFYGVWRWLYVLNSANDEVVSVEKLTMGMGKLVKTELLKDSISYEHKNKLKGSGLSKSQKGKWYYNENEQSLNFKPKERWIRNEIIYFSQDTLVLKMMGPLNLYMVREK